VSRSTLVIFALTFCSVGSPLSADTPAATGKSRAACTENPFLGTLDDEGVDVLWANSRELLRLSGILRDLAAEAANPRHRAAAKEMHHIAERAAEYLDAAAEFLKLDRRMQDDRDRSSTLFTVHLRARTYARHLDARGTDTMLALDYASADPSNRIVSEADCLRKRLDEAKQALETLASQTGSELERRVSHR
jgi:hypothetical protein